MFGCTPTVCAKMRVQRALNATLADIIHAPGVTCQPLHTGLDLQE